LFKKSKEAGAALFRGEGVIDSIRGEEFRGCRELITVSAFLMFSRRIEIGLFYSRRFALFAVTL
jgi:hypothetical protein